MNNNDFYGNLDKIRKLYLKQNYDEAVRIADKMDFKRLKDWKYLAMLINLYEAVGRLEDVRYFCILAYNRNLGGKKLLYKLTKVYIRLDEIDDAEELYDEYVETAGRDNKKYELLYELKAVQGAKKTELIKILEDFMKRDLDEKYAYTLAELYAKTKQNEKCVNFCEKIIDRFEVGDAVEQAIELKNSILNPGAAADNAEVAKSRNTVRLEEISLDTNSLPVTDIQAQTAPIADVQTQQAPVMDIQEQPILQEAAMVGQDTLGMNVEEIMAQSQSFDAMKKTDNTRPISLNTQAEEPEDISATQQFMPVNGINAFYDEPGSQAAAVDDAALLGDTKVVPLDAEDESALREININDTIVLESVAPAPEVPEQTMPEQTIAEQVMPEQAVSEPEVSEPEAEEPEPVDRTPDAGMTGTQDIESTVAMVEAALADEANAAQFEARMDMPEYNGAYEQSGEPEAEKLVLRPFQPEIDAVYEIPMEVKRYFTKYSEVAGLENQIGEYFESTKYEDKKGTSGIGNIIISGNRSSDKTTLAINIVKALNVLYPENARKIARTTGDNINQRGIERSIGKLLGAALIIEEAGVLDRQRILELVEVMETNTQELLIILEDSESEITELLKNNPELLEKFNHRITYKQFTVNELVEMCKRYADKCSYTIDEKALLQLYLRIDEIHSSEDGVSLEDVRDVIDTAIESAEKRANKKLFGSAKKKKVGNKEYTILFESDFK